MDVTKTSVLCLLGIATSIDAFVIGIGLGLDKNLSQVLLIVTVIFLMTFLVSITGVFLGKRNIPIPEKTASVIAGLVLVGLGAYTLFEHLAC